MELERGIRALLARRIRVTVDLMSGLPGQTGDDIRSSVDWAVRLKGARSPAEEVIWDHILALRQGGLADFAGASADGSELPTATFGKK